MANDIFLKSKLYDAQRAIDRKAIRLMDERGISFEQAYRMVLDGNSAGASENVLPERAAQ